MTVGRILANNIDQGSGFALATSHARMSRVVLTAKHVIGDQDPSSLQFLTEDKRRIPVERVEWDSNLDVAVLLLRDAVAEGLAVGLAIEGAAWQVETQPRPNDPKLYGTISDMHRRFVKQDGEHEIYVLQLYEQQNLGDYKGYSGSPVVLKSSTDAVIGVLIEQLRSRLSMQTGLPKPATNVLYAIPIQDVLNRFGLTAVYDMEALRKKYESFKKRVKPAITDKDIEQLIELDPSITSRLFDGSLPLGEPGTRTTIVLLIKAFALKKAVYSEDEANEFLQTVFPEDHLREENPEDARVLDLLKLQQVGPSIPHSDRAMQLGPIFGRNEDIATILRLLQESRLVTLTGAAGIGKTRLALEVKNRLKDTASYSSAYISLASLEPNAPVLPAMIWQLGIPNIGDAASLCEHLLARMQTIENYLLILDNFEHVLTIEAKDVLTTLLERCPKLTILVTSRTILHIEYEQVFSVKPLSVPMAGRIKGSPDLSHYSATALFLYVAQARVSHTPLLITEDAAAKIGDICRMLDGLPLAIRIVASKFSKLSIEEIYEKVLSIEALTLRNEDTELKRQQTLLETFNWSYDLLSPEQQNLFRGLAVFVGGCNYDAAKAVCEKGEEDIGQLIDSSLLEIESIDGASRLYMLRTIYEYAQNKLRDKTFKKQAGALRRRHRNFFLARAVVSENKLRGPEQVACFKQLERDWENIQAALAGSEPFVQLMQLKWDSPRLRQWPVA